jgi:hypothetical protein
MGPEHKPLLLGGIGNWDPHDQYQHPRKKTTGKPMKDYQLYITGNIVKFYIIANEQCSKHFNTPCHSIHCACWLRSGFLS